MNQNLKHILLFEEMISNSNESGIFTPLIKLKEVAEQATSFNDYQKGIDTINTYLSNNDEAITSSLDAISKLPVFRYSKMINIYSLIFPFIKKWGSEIIDKEISSNIELDVNQIEVSEPEFDLDDIDLGDVEIDD